MRTELKNNASQHDVCALEELSAVNSSRYYRTHEVDVRDRNGSRSNSAAGALNYKCNNVL
jgi:hypothetical protein